MDEAAAPTEAAPLTDRELLNLLLAQVRIIELLLLEDVGERWGSARVSRWCRETRAMIDRIKAQDATISRDAMAAFERTAAELRTRAAIGDAARDAAARDASRNN